MHPAHAAVGERDIDLAEVVLRELAGQPLEAHLDGDARGAHRGDEFVQRALPARVAGQAGAPQDLDREQRRRLGDEIGHELPIRLGLARPAHARRRGRGQVQLSHRRLLRHPAHGALVDADKARHLDVQVAGRHQDLDRMPLEH